MAKEEVELPCNHQCRACVRRRSKCKIWQREGDGFEYAYRGSICKGVFGDIGIEVWLLEETEVTVSARFQDNEEVGALTC